MTAASRYVEIDENELTEPLCCVYRVMAEDKSVLYIGSTTRFEKRLAEHRRRSSWWQHAHWFSQRWYISPAYARIAEANAIRTEHPTYNIQHRQFTKAPKWLMWSDEDIHDERCRLIERQDRLTHQLARNDADLAVMADLLDADGGAS